MAGLEPAQANQEQIRDPISERHNARLGLLLFAIYFAVYASYVAINAFWPSLMDIVPVAGLNWAVVAGLGLIIGAIVLATIYAAFSKSPKDAA